MKWHAIANEILPPGVNKARGLQTALKIHSLSSASVIGVGDSENDHAYLKLCGLPAAVANAMPNHSAGAAATEPVDAVLRGDFDRHIRMEMEATG